MFWKKEKQLEGKFVRYSQNTALVNPKMIEREYDQTIKEAEEVIETYKTEMGDKTFISMEVKSYKKKKYDPYLFHVTGFEVDSIKVKTNSVKMKVNPRFLKKKLEEYDNMKIKLDRFDRELEGMIEERRYFLRQYSGDLKEWY